MMWSKPCCIVGSFPTTAPTSRSPSDRVRCRTPSRTLGSAGWHNCRYPGYHTKLATKLFPCWFNEVYRHAEGVAVQHGWSQRKYTKKIVWIGSRIEIVIICLSSKADRNEYVRRYAPSEVCHKEYYRSILHRKCNAFIRIAY